MLRLANSMYDLGLIGIIGLVWRKWIVFRHYQ